MRGHMGWTAVGAALLIGVAVGMVCGSVGTRCVMAADAPAKPVESGLPKRIPLTTSKVVGSPDPPLPLTAEKIFPKIPLVHPLYLIELPGTTDLLVVPQDGKIVRIDNGDRSGSRKTSDPDVEKSTLFLDVKRETYGLGFHPKFAENGYMYVLSNGDVEVPVKDAPAKDVPKDHKGETVKAKMDHLSRFTVSRKPPYECDPASELLILKWFSNGHNGGEPAFGPDGMLYVPTGDGTSDSDTDDSGQDVKDLNAVMIRIDVDHPDPDRPYSIPKDNPFVGVEGARPEIWAYGFRNPWRSTFDAKTGHHWVGNIGQDRWEMIHLVRKGENYGWAAFEGSHPFHALRKLGPTPVVKPTIEHPHSEARSITGGVVYYGKKYPEFEGCYIYGDYSTGKIWAAKHDGTKLTFHQEIADTTAQVLAFAVDHRGDILMADYGGALWKLTRVPKVENPPKFPTKLSETGLFVSTKGHQVQPGLIPYSVNAALWSDGAHKERWIAVPGDGQIDFTPKNGWNFPDESVLVKSFWLDMEAGKPESRRIIETRLLTKQQNEWIGYSYLWNDAQDDAELVGAKGVDKSYTICDTDAPGGTREHVWHYPSRADCMVCHSRAANYVLGPSLVQFNRDHDYGVTVPGGATVPGGKVANQIRTLEQIGMFKPASKAAIDKALAEPAEKTRLVDPYDAAQPLEARVRSYLHANCSICHVEAGGGNSKMQLEFVTERDKMSILDVKPQHQSFDLPDARVIAPGSPERSVMFQRLSRRGQGQMPPLATDLRDERGLMLFREWIQSLKK